MTTPRISGTLRLKKPPVALPPTQAPIVANSGPAASREVNPAPSRRTIAELFGILATTYPKLFDPAAPLPLAIGIHKKLRDRLDLTHSEIKRALTVWCQRELYQQTLIRSSLRHDLDGSTSYITPEQIAFAKSRLEQKGKTK